MISKVMMVMSCLFLRKITWDSLRIPRKLERNLDSIVCREDDDT